MHTTSAVSKKRIEWKAVLFVMILIVPISISLVMPDLLNRSDNAGLYVAYTLALLFSILLSYAAKTGDESPPDNVAFGVHLVTLAVSIWAILSSILNWVAIPWYLGGIATLAYVVYVWKQITEPRSYGGFD